LGINCWGHRRGIWKRAERRRLRPLFARNPAARKEIFLITKLKNLPPDELTPGLDKGLKRLNTTYVDLFFIHGVGNLNDIGAPVREWAAQMKKAGKIKFFGYSCHSNMEDCLLASAKSEWVDAVMFSYNFG